MGRAYNQAIGVIDEPEEVKPIVEDALLAQERINWLSSPGTKVLFKTLGEQIKALEAEARVLSTTYHIHQNHLKIIQLLNHADNLQKIIDSYRT